MPVTTHRPRPGGTTNTSADRAARTFFVLGLLATATWCQSPATWGNLTGQILSAKTPASGARITISRTRQSTSADSLGNFLLSGIPLESWDGDEFEIEIAYGDATARSEGIHIPPGAWNAPKLRFAFARVQDTNFVYDTRDGEGSGESGTPPQPAPAPRISEGSPSAIFATREGLVGLTTANGHVIVANDRFVALPSRRALNRSDAATDLEFEVDVSIGTKIVRLPVWDVGPWNTKDDWWNTPTFRQSPQNLPRWTPWAQAAFASGYNGGLDQSGRTVKNPAGIDLADGAFWQDLSMADNGLVGVRMRWMLDGIPGQRIKTRHWAKVRGTPGGSLLDTVQCGTKGTILAGPDSATVSGHWYLFYHVRWDDDTRSGWSAEPFLDADTSNGCSDPVAGTTRRSPLARLVGNRLMAATASPLTEFVLYAADGSVVARSTPLDARIEWDLPVAHQIQFVSVSSAGRRQILTRLP